MPARLFFRTKQLLKHFSKAFLLSAFLLVAVLGNIHSASADTNYDPAPAADSTYDDFLNLFTPTSGPLFRLSGWAVDSTGKADGVKFLLRGKFDQLNPTVLSQTTSSDTPRMWYWNHIVNLKDAKNAFVVRTCPIVNGAMDKDNCTLSLFPYDNYPPAGSNGECKLSGDPCPPEVFTKAIYKFRSYQGWDVDKNEELQTNFEVETPLRQFHPISKISGGDLPTASTALQPGGTYQSDLWYCAGNNENSNFTITKPNDANISEKDRIKYFGDICKGEKRYFFRIGDPVVFTFPADKAQTDATNPNDGANAAGTTQDTDPRQDNLPTCAWFGLGSGSFTGCIAKVVYFGIYRPVAWFAGLMGSLFDFFLGYSISDESYRYDFVVTGWRIVRDISNIFFIVILIWTGLMAVFNSEKVTLKKVLPTVILNALLINFSLFGTRVVVDLSNIVTRVFYNTVEVCEGKCRDDNGDGKPDNPKLDSSKRYKSLSEKIVSSFNPQQLFSPDLFKNPLPENNASNQSLFGVQDSENANEGFSRGDTDYAALYIVVSLIGAIILFAIAVMFWNTAFLFLGRIIGIYVAMIFSPFAVLTRGNVPILGNIESLKWSDWWKELSSYAMVAPIFVFFLYVVYMFIDADWMKFTQIGGGSFFERVLAVGIPMLFIFFIVKRGVGIAKKYSGSIGNMVQNFVSGTVGGVGGLIGGGVGLAAGGVGFIGRNLVGRGVSLAGKIGTGRDKDGKRVTLASRLASQADSNWFARQGNNFMKWNKTSTWDPRNISAKVGGKTYTALGTFNKGVGLLGKPVGEGAPKDTISGKLGLGKDDGKGGLKKQREDRVKARKEKINKKMNFDHLSDTEAKSAWQAHVEKKSLKLAREELDKSGAAEQYAEGKSPIYKQVNADIKTKVEDYGKKADDIKKTTAALSDPKLTAEQKTALTTQLENQKKELGGLDTDIKNLKKKRAEEFANITKTHGKFEDSDEYKKQLAEVQQKKRAEVDKYGDIKNGKTLTAAMRAEYAEDLRKSSMWMFNGKPDQWARGIFGGSAAGGTYAGAAALGVTALSGPIAAITGALAAAVGAYVQEEADIVDQAAKEIIESTKKSQGKGTKKAKLEGTHKMLKDKLKGTLEKAYNTTIDNLDELLATNYEYIEKGLAMRSLQMDQEIKEAQEKLVAAHKAYLAETDAELKKKLKATRDEIEVDIAYKKQERAHLSNLRNEVDRAEDALDRYTTKETENEEKAKKKAEEEKGGKGSGGDKGAGKEEKK